MKACNSRPCSILHFRHQHAEAATDECVREDCEGAALQNTMAEGSSSESHGKRKFCASGRQEEMMIDREKGVQARKKELLLCQRLSPRNNAM
jgi:hypothetical protein